ncbi:RNA-directed DNA polymerase, eukaryota [Tanacetum coccineum]
MNILRCFSLLSGMSINIQKSHLLGVGIPDNCVAEAAKSIGCLIMKAPFKYLGILVGDNMSSKKAWDETINKMKKRLSRNFFNGIQEGDRKIAWVKWSKVLASKKFGGLGVSSFFALNRALLFKWVWRYLSHDNSLWFRIISALHGLNGHVLSAAFNSTWSSMKTEVNPLKVKVSISNFSLWVWVLNGDGGFKSRLVRSMFDEAFLPNMGSFLLVGILIRLRHKNIDELSNKLIQEEARLKKHRVHSVNLVNQGVDKKLKPKSKNFKKKQHATTSKVANGKKREQQNNKCNFCRKDGHFQKDCPKRKAWFERKCLGPFVKFLESRGICAQYTMSGTPQQNGVAERQNRTLMEMVGSMITEAQVYNLQEKKLDSQTVSGYFIGYPEKSKGYSSYCQNHGSKIVETRNAKFLKNVEIGGSVENQVVDINEIRDDDPSPINVHKSTTTPDVVPFLEGDDFDIGIDNDPVSFSQAIKSDKFEMWIDVMKEKLKSMAQNKVWDLVNMPEASKPIGCKWVFKTKRTLKTMLKDIKLDL